VGFLVNDYNQVSVDSSATCRVALAGHGKLHARGKPCRDGKGYHLLCLRDAFTVALRAFFGDDLALAAADVTGCGGLHLPQDGVHNPGGVAGALAGGACRHITV